MNGFLNDLRFGIRQLAAKPGFAAAAILTLALGIGANTAVFSVLSGYLFKPLPYPHGNQLVRAVINIPKLRDKPIPHLSQPIDRVINRQTDAFAATALYDRGSTSIVAGGRAKYVGSIFSSASLFDVLGIKPLLGRTFKADDALPGNGDIIVISYKLWHTAFGADPDIIGKTVYIDDGRRQIIGVMPKGFAFPNRRTAVWAVNTVRPDDYAPDEALDLDSYFIGRLRPGVNLQNAEAQVQQAVGVYLRDKVPAQLKKMTRGSGFSMGLRPYRRVLLGDQSTTLWLLQGAVLLILLITCVNVANLLLSRIFGRSHEMAIRSTLGATRSVLARQLLAEALSLTVPGGFIGVALAWVGLQIMVRSPLGTGDTIFSIAFDWRVGLFALGAVLLTAVLVSILPIHHLAKTDLQSILQEGSRTAGGGRGAKRMRNALVIAELTLATGLLAMSGLLLHSFMNLENVDPGFRKDHVLIAKLLVPMYDHVGDNDKALGRFYIDLRQRVRALPGVKQVAMTRALPLMGARQNTPLPVREFSIPGQKEVSGKPPVAMFNIVSSDYFKALGIQILHGRAFDAHDVNKPTIIIDTGLARKYFHGANSIGRKIKVYRSSSPFTVVGVVPSIKYASLSTTAASTTIYINNALITNFAGASHVATFVIHTTMAPTALIKPLRNAVAALDPNVAVFDVHTMQEQMADALRDKQTTTILLLAFGAIALALAIIGVYAVMSHAVGQRRAEWGVRLALGALSEDLSWLVFRDGFKFFAVGLVLGLGLTVLFGYLISSQLFGVAPFDPVTLMGSALMLCATTMVACYLPARRAAKLDPAAAMMEQ